MGGLMLSVGDKEIGCVNPMKSDYRFSKQTYEYYMRRNGRYYFRGVTGKFSIELGAEHIIEDDLKYGNIVEVEYN